MRQIVNILGVLLVLTCSCANEDSLQEDRLLYDEENVYQYLVDNNIVANRDPSGVYYEVLIGNETNRPVELNDVVTVHYTISTLYGPELERSTSGEPVSFLHDYKSVIPLGLDYGLDLMREGERYRFYIPSGLAFGALATYSFDAYSGFIVELEVVDIQTLEEKYECEMKDIRERFNDYTTENISFSSSGLIYTSITAGTGESPVADSKVQINFECSYLDSTLVEKSNPQEPVALTLSDDTILEGLRETILGMKAGGKSSVVMPSRLAFGSSIQVLPVGERESVLTGLELPVAVLPFSTLIYDIELLTVD